MNADEMPVFWACGVDAAIGGRDGEAGVLHHALSGMHAGHGPEEFRICDYGEARFGRDQKATRAGYSTSS